MTEYMRRDFLGIEGDGTLAERNISVYSFDTVDSTNSLARRMMMSGEAKAPALVVADGQTGGRGRMGRSFYSPSDTGIYMTLVFDVTDDPEASVMRMTSAVAVAVSRVIGRVTDRSVGIKWVNDLYFDSKKICGILAESFFCERHRYVAIGVGINLTTTDFPAELSNIAGSLSVGENGSLRRELVLAASCEIYDVYEKVKLGDNSYMDEYRSRSVVIGKRVTYTWNGEIGGGTVERVDDEGALLIRCDDGSERTLCSGEISLRISEE